MWTASSALRLFYYEAMFVKGQLCGKQGVDPNALRSLNLNPESNFNADSSLEYKKNSKNWGKVSFCIDGAFPHVQAASSIGTNAPVYCQRRRPVTVCWWQDIVLLFSHSTQIYFRRIQNFDFSDHGTVFSLVHFKWSLVQRTKWWLWIIPHLYHITSSPWHYRPLSFMQRKLCSLTKPSSDDRIKPVSSVVSQASN